LVGVLAVVASGCRFHFDEVASDATIGDVRFDLSLVHDEDSDGIPDGSDTCPMAPDATNADGDGDGVGDICDSEPTVSRQQWALFSAMTDASVPFAAGPAGAWTMNSDDWHYNNVEPVQAQLIRTKLTTDVDIWVGIEVEQLGSNGAQAAIVINGTNTPYYYGEIFDGGTGARVQVIQSDGSSYLALDSTPLGTSFPLGRTDIYVAARTAGPSFTIGARGQAASAAAPGYGGDMLLILAFSRHSGRVRYIGVVESQ
jgi:hypothetical protein